MNLLSKADKNKVKRKKEVREEGFGTLISFLKRKKMGMIKKKIILQRWTSRGKVKRRIKIERKKISIEFKF